MLRKRAIVAFLVCGLLVVGLRANERASFILTDGERVSGILNYHTPDRVGLFRDQFAVGRDDGTEFYVWLDQVAVIDFIGGRPKNEELAALPAHEGHLLVMRTWSTQRGRLINLIGGDTVRWKPDGGNEQDLPIRQVARIHMNADGARRYYDYTPPAAVPPPATTAGAGSSNPPTRQQRLGTLFGGAVTRVDVRGGVPWTDTGMLVEKGDRIRFVTSGEVYYTRNDIASPDGKANVMNRAFPVRDMGVGGLIARIGTGPAFPIGSNQEPIVMPAKGRLMLGINDDFFDDNSGVYRVQVGRAR
jgi:PA-IL-like protein